jgi:hypothetical protein
MLVGPENKRRRDNIRNGQGSRSRCGRFSNSSHAAGDHWKVALLPFLRKLPNREHLRRRA